MADNVNKQALQVLDGGKLSPEASSTKETHESALKVIEEAKDKKTLKEYLKDLEDSKDITDKVTKLRRLQLVLMSVSNKIDFDPDNVGLITLPGNQVGEAYTEESRVVVDPVILEKDDLSLFKHTLLHELSHLLIDNEGLNELRTMILTGDESFDYDNLVENVSQVTGILADDKESGVLRAVELYSNGQYDQLFEEFEEAYSKKFSDRVEKNPDAAFNIFQLAFPELKLVKNGNLDVSEEDEEGDIELPLAA